MEVLATIVFIHTVVLYILLTRLLAVHARLAKTNAALAELLELVRSSESTS